MKVKDLCLLGTYTPVGKKCNKHNIKCIVCSKIHEMASKMSCSFEYGGQGSL